MSAEAVNLASRPFSNQAPVLRVSVVLGLVALTLMVLNVLLYWSYFSGSGEDARAELVEVEQKIAGVDKELAGIERRVASFDLDALGDQASYLNLRIVERSFGWGRLFADLAGVLPMDVRLERLSPNVRRRSTPSGDVTDVLLTLHGAARRDEALLELVDAMFASPRFEDPDPSRESRRDADLQFVMTVIYNPPKAAAKKRGSG